MANDPIYIVVHHSAIPGDRKQFDRIDDYHYSRWQGATKSSIGHYGGYHRLIEKDGEKRRFREDNEEGAHALIYWPPYWGMNKKSIGICLAGDFTREPPAYAQLKSLRELLDHYKSFYGIADVNVLLHREVKSTSCPGVDLVYLADHLFTTDYGKQLEQARAAYEYAKRSRNDRRARMLARKIVRLEKLIDGGENDDMAGDRRE